MAMCGVTRAPFNSNRSSCGIEVVVPFFFYPKFEHARICSVPIYRLDRCERANPQSRAVSSRMAGAIAQEEIEPTGKFLRPSKATLRWRTHFELLA